MSAEFVVNVRGICSKVLGKGKWVWGMPLTHPPLQTLFTMMFAYILILPGNLGGLWVYPVPCSICDGFDISLSWWLCASTSLTFGAHVVPHPPLATPMGLAPSDRGNSTAQSLIIARHLPEVIGVSTFEGGETKSPQQNVPEQDISSCSMLLTMIAVAAAFSRPPEKGRSSEHGTKLSGD